MLTRIIIWGAVVVAVTALCVVRPQAGRLFVGGFFGVMGLGVHGYLVIQDPEGYVGFADRALLPLYRQIGLFLTEPNPRVFGIAMLVLEMTLAALILSRGHFVKVGIAGAILFLVGISPLGFDVLPNILLAAALAYLLTQDFPRDALTMLRDRRDAARLASHTAQARPMAGGQFIPRHHGRYGHEDSRRVRQSARSDG